MLRGCVMKLLTQASPLLPPLMTGEKYVACVKATMLTIDTVGPHNELVER